jgi:hypothetical protein
MIYVPDRIIFAPVLQTMIRLTTSIPTFIYLLGFTRCGFKFCPSSYFQYSLSQEICESRKFKDDSTVLNIKINNLEITQFSGKKEVVEKVYLIKTEVQVLDAVTTKKFRAKK